MSDNHDDFDTHKGFNQKHKKKAFKEKKNIKKNGKNDNIIIEEINEGNDDNLSIEEENLEEDLEKVDNHTANSKFFAKSNEAESEESESEKEEEEEEDVLMVKKNKKQKGKGKNRIKNLDIDTSSKSTGSMGTLNTPSTINSFLGTPSFISGGDFGFGTDSEFNQILTPEQQINSLFENKIHIHKILRPGKANKFDIVISNLNMTDINVGKALVRKIKIGCGVGGAVTTNKDIEKNGYVISLNSHDGERIKNFLIDNYGVDEDMIVDHT